MKRLRFGKKLEPASFWKRVVAYVIDILLIEFLIASPFQGYFSSIMPDDLSFRELISYFASGQVELGNILIASLSLMAITLLYWTLLEWKLGQSIGKMIVNISVHSTIKKESMNFKKSLVRNLSKVSTILLAADVIYMLVKKQHQRWLEEKSSTEVVEKKEKVIL